ncbi:MAG TPA: response regulator [Bacteroidales bacterium]
MSSEKSTILYIDDDLLNLEIFREYFEDTYRVIILPSTEDALKILKRNKVKVIISDQCMPDETGTDFIKRINPEYPDVIKMILTAYTDYDAALEAINEVGIYKYLLKPWDATEMKNSIDSAIREYDLRYENKALLFALKQKNEALNLAYNKLEENEKKFRSIFANSNDGIYILNGERKVIEANQALNNLLFKKKKTCDLDYLNQFIKTTCPVLLDKPLELLHGTASFIFELEITTENGDDKTVEINCSGISYNDDHYVLSVVRDISERRMFEKKIVNAIIQTQEDDQSRYARELHDGLGPLLSTIKMHVEWLANSSNTTNKDKIIEHSIHTIDNAIRSVKEIANSLSPHILQRFGLVNAVNSYIDRIRDTLKIEFVVSSNLKERIPGNMEIIMYRAIMECINNSVKHAEAKKIILKFNKQKNNLLISCSDDGKGFDTQKVLTEGKGMGLFNIQNRIKHIGGEVEIASKPNVGTDMIFRIKV